MRRAFIAVLIAVTGGAWNVHAATCTVTSAKVLVKAVDLEGPLTGLVGFAIPVEIDAATGSFRMDTTTIPPIPFHMFVDNTLQALDMPSAGTIDASGNVVIPDVGVHFTTDSAPGQDIGSIETLNSGIAAVTLSGADYATVGAPLDFTTGALRIEGQAVLLNAPTIGQVTSGISLACTLSPIPSRDQLPAGPSVVAHGVAKPGKSGDPGTVVGDVLTLKAKAKNGTVALDPSQDVFVRIAVGGTEVVLLRVPAGALAGGRKLTASDGDGTTLRVLTGRKRDGSALADVAGSIVVVKSKKGLALSVKESGLDLAAGEATVTIGVGPLAASDQVTVKPGAKKTVLK